MIPQEIDDSFSSEKVFPSVSKNKTKKKMKPQRNEDRTLQETPPSLKSLKLQSQASLFDKSH